MNEKIKEILYSILVVAVILFLGFSPVSQTVLYSLNWGDLGIKMVEAGVIDNKKMENLHMMRGGMTDSDRKFMYGDNGALEINDENSAMALHMLWALGLSNKNPVLEEGPMMDPRYGGVGNFASTGGWTLGKGGAMDHYNMHKLVTLTAREQLLVERVAKNVYRPCCKNSTYFPDCNHGMAMLGLLELMASQGATEKEMYKTAEEVNALWFPGQTASEQPKSATGCGA